MKWKNSVEIIATFILLSAAGPSCTKLETKVYDQVPEFWKTHDQIVAGVSHAYVDLRSYGSTFSGPYALNEVSTDEIIVPIRAGNWADNGDWELMWKHTWTPDHHFFSDSWKAIYGGISRINSVLDDLNKFQPKLPELDSLQAELKTIRAFYYFTAIDLFGRVPIYENGQSDCESLKTRERKEVFEYTVKELKNSLPKLTDEISTRTYGRATKWFAQAILAKLYLNAIVYTGAPRWDECIEACDVILKSNRYRLEQDFFSNFKISNEGSKENIFVIPFDFSNGLGVFAIQTMTLHYASYATFGLQSGGANGFCSTGEYYALFDANDYRRQMFLVGQQYIGQVVDPGNLQYDTEGNLLIFDPAAIKTFNVPKPDAERAGARCAKWEFNREIPFFTTMSNDFAIFRLSDIILMQAEAQLRKGDAGLALITINQKINGVSIRSRAHMPDFKVSEMVLDTLLNERARELSWEGWRRNDLVRFGHFTDARIPEKGKSADYRNLYPIPQTELYKNPCLQQNPGYPK